MLCIVGIIGIVGCIWIVGVAAGVAVIASGVSAGYQIAGYYDAKDAAEDMYDLQLDAHKKAENREDFNQALQERMQAKNQARLRSQMGSAIALDHLRAKKSKYKTIKKEAELNSISGNKSNVTTSKPNVYNLGKPTSGQVE